MMSNSIEINLWRDCAIQSKLRIYRREDGEVRPAMLIIPGGGYGSVCDSTEGAPIAHRFEELGFQVFVLLYRVAPHCYPAPQLDAFRAIRLIRAHAQEWCANPDELAVCGFSAGGHLAACCGTLYRDLDAKDGDEADAMSQRPDAMVLCYPVISSGEKAHVGSFQNLLNENFEELKDSLSLEKLVDGDTPPAFVWHTAADQVVPYENSVLFAQAMWRNGRKCALQVYPTGPHGMQLGYYRKDIAAWPVAAMEFCRLEAGFHLNKLIPRHTVVLTFDDAVKNHLTFVAPLLKKYNFGATFFPCRFSDDWRSKHEEYLLSGNELKQLYDMGFEIGNHTWTHGLPASNEQALAYEIDELTTFLKQHGIPAPVSFAYPGGPYAAHAVKALIARGFQCARTTEKRPWLIGADDPMRVPAYAISKNDRVGFYEAIHQCTSDNTVVLVFHGIPDIVHPWCTNEPQLFQEMMEFLATEQFRVISMQEAMTAK